MVVLGLFSMTDENYKNLASSIVLLAIDDVVRCMQGKRPIGLNYKDMDFEEIIQENYKFFRSDWFNTLSDLDGEKIVTLFEKNREKIKSMKKIKIKNLIGGLDE